MENFENTLKNLIMGLSFLNVNFQIIGSYELNKRGLIKRAPSDIDFLVSIKNQEKVVHILGKLGYSYTDFLVHQVYQHFGYVGQFDIKLTDETGTKMPVSIQFTELEVSGEISDLDLIEGKKKALENRDKISDTLDVYYIEYGKEINEHVAEKIVTCSKKIKKTKIETIHLYELVSGLVS